MRAASPTRRVTTALAALAAALLGAPGRGLPADHSPVPELSFDLKENKAEATSANYRLGGDAAIVNGIARLTEDAQGKAGWMWSKVPTPGRMADEWTMEFDVQLHGRSSSMSGDGLAIWLTTRPLDGDAAPSGGGHSLGPNFAMPAAFSGLGVFLDTFDNAPGQHSRRFPYVSGVFHREPVSADQGDREYAHNTPEFAHAMDQSQGCSEPIRSSDAHGPATVKTVTLRLEYEGPPPGAAADSGGGGILVASVLVSAGSRQSDDSPARAWHQCFVLRGVDLPDGLFVGASASTGDLHDAHDVDRVRAYAPAAAKPRRARAAPAPSPDAGRSASRSAEAASSGDAAGRGDGGPLCEARSDADLDAVVSATATVRDLRADVARAEGSVGDAQKRLTRRVESGVRRLEESIAALERSKRELDSRHEALTRRAVEVEEAAKALAARRGGWWEGAVVLAVIAMGVVSAVSLYTSCSASDRLTKAHDL